MSSVVISGNTSGTITLDAPAVAGTTTLTLPATTGTVSLTANPTDITINGLTVGKGGGSPVTGTVLGYQALASNTSGSSGNMALGFQALYSNTTGDSNTAVGRYQTMYSNLSGSSNCAFGQTALYTNSSGSNNTALGMNSLYSNSTGFNSVAIGYNALYSSTTGSNNTAVGYQAGFTNVTGSGTYGNAFFGANAGYSNTGQDNTYIGGSAASTCGSGGGNVAIGFGAGNSNASVSIFNIANLSDRIVIGSQNTTNAYVKVAWTVTSDARDKTDVENSQYGLSFINSLRPVTFVWDERSRYVEGNSDGSKKGTKRQLGFLSQEVIQTELNFGATQDQLLIADNDEADRLKITETKFIPALVKAIQELKTELDAVKAELATLKGTTL